LTSTVHPSSRPYTLAGPAGPIDRRVTAVRGDLADVALAGKVFVPHYVVPMERAVCLGSVALLTAPAASAEQASELLRGERFLVLDLAGDWAWGYGAHDDYLGYLTAAALGDPATVPPPPPPDGAEPAAVAETLVGTPYVWGGRGGEGLDCSGLVQIAFARAGHALPRDSDQQAASAGRPLAPGEAPRRGDLAFFPGHVGILRDPDHLLHASQERARVLVEPLADVVARKGPVTLFRRVA
jgi:cell wall-associated NlpC family hydrolase